MTRPPLHRLSSSEDPPPYPQKVDNLPFFFGMTEYITCLTQALAKLSIKPMGQRPFPSFIAQQVQTTHTEQFVLFTVEILCLYTAL